MTILAFMPTFAPDTEAVLDAPNRRGYTRATQVDIAYRINDLGYLSRIRPWVYMDCIDSVLNIRPDVDLVVADARSTDSIREHLRLHQEASCGHNDHPGYSFALFPEKASQWHALNTVYTIHATPETKYFVYTSSDIIWTHDWVAPAIEHFEKDPTLQILFPYVNSGDPALPHQISTGPHDGPLIDPADFMECEASRAARAPVLNAYAFIVRRDFFDEYGGYPTAYKNCFTESFLYYMCEAMGGKMRLMPQGWVYHHNGIDQHGIGTADGGYNYLAEKPTFDKIMDEVQAARAAGTDDVAFYKRMLYV